MISITRATPEDYKSISHIGLISVEEAHRGSCPPQILNTYLKNHYNDLTLIGELNDPKNLYHILYYHDKPVGFSKIILNVQHANISNPYVTKLDRIYLLSEFHQLKLGAALLNYNIEYSRANHQQGMWLFTWIGNTKAIRFYHQAGFKIIGSHQFEVTKEHLNENHHMFMDYSL
ncbi:MAG: GNAT family N-acetyltransferase [Chitinophagaceae bacterium]|nr:GNAT family N-acetyltransferase [Chitinophagaceae bacterium]